MLINLLLYFLLKLPFLAIAITPMITTNRAKNMHTIKMKGKILFINIVGTYQKILKCRLIDQFIDKNE